MIVGRDAEQTRITALLQAARSGTGGALVLVGHAGIGKTTLLEWAADRAAPLHEVRVTGVRAERDVPYAALHALLTPLLTEQVLAELPGHQREGLLVALGRRLGPPPGALLVGAATLGVLTAGEGLLVLVDDVQWVDGASAQVITFAARRVGADPVAFLLTERTGEAADSATAGLPRIVLGGIARAERLVPQVNPLVARRLAELVAGNPLALIEAARSLTPGQSVGTEMLGGAPPVTDPEEGYAHRLAVLPRPARRAAHVVALAGRARADVLRAALADLGLDDTDLAAVERSGLVRVDIDQPHWVHPLARAAAGRAPLAERRAAHRALAAGWERDDPAHPARAWHLADAAEGPDDAVADLLVEVAEAAAREDASAPAADAYERAARLSTVRARRHELLERAAAAAVRAGWTARAIRLCDEALRLQPSEEAAGRLLHTRGRLEVVAGDPARATEVLRQSIALCREPAVRCWAAVDGAIAAMLSGRVEQCARFALLAGAAHDAGDPVQRYQVAFLDGMAARFDGDLGRARAHFDGAAGMLAAEDLLSRQPGLTLLAVAAPLHAERAEPIGPHEQEGIDRLRLSGDLTYLPRVLRLAAHRVPDDAASYAWLEESELLSRLAGQTTILAHALLELAFLDAVRGDVERSAARSEEAVHLVTRHRIRWLRSAVAAADHALCQARGDHVGALRVLRELPAEDRESVLPELVDLALVVEGEEAARAELDAAPAAYEQLPRRLATAILDPDPASAGTDIAAAARELAMGFERGRYLLLAGERLRRAGLRREAREVLHEARTALAAAGAASWVARADQELAASGRVLQRSGGHDLTPSELRVASVVAQGRTNKEAAALLFLSTKTVEFHLGRAFRKLGVTNRTALAAALAARGDLPR